MRPSPQASASPLGGLTTTTSLYGVVKEYVERLLPSDRTMKVLLVDDVTLHIISMSFSQTALLNRGVYLVDRIGGQRQRREMKNMRCIMFIRPDSVSVDAACAELEMAKYSAYAIGFCGTTCPEHLDRLARADRDSLVKQVEEYFCDFCPVNRDAFMLESIPPYELTSAHVGNAQIRRIAEGLAAMSVAQRRRPLVRCQQNSPFARRVAAELADIYRRDPELYNYRHKDAVLLIVDRNLDPVTPLLTPWTYQAMLHELIGLDHNRLQLPKDVAGAEEEGYVFSQQDDTFFAANMCNNWGDLCNNVKVFVDKCKAALNLDRSTATMEDIKKFILKMPQTKNLAGSVAKHATVSGHLSQTIKERDLLQISLLEQNMVAASDAQEHWKKLMTFASQAGVRDQDILRLCLLYNLKYERADQPSRTSAILDRISSTHTQLLRKMRAYYGETKSTECLFADTGVVATIVKTFVDVGNIYTQHEPVLKNTLFQLCSGKLDNNAYPYQGSTPAAPSGEGDYKPRDVMVFMCGGFTYAEAALVHAFNSKSLYKPSDSSQFAQSGVQASIGGECILNSSMFIERLSRT